VGNKLNKASKLAMMLTKITVARSVACIVAQTKQGTFFALLIATTWPSRSSALYTLPKEPSPIIKFGEKLCVSLITCSRLRFNGSFLLGDEDNENLDGLAGTRSGLPGILSEIDLSSEELTEKIKVICLS